MTRTNRTMTISALFAVLLALSGLRAARAWPPDNCKDFVTGGGWYAWHESAASFGINAGYRTEDGALKGHFNYVDHNTGLHVTATTIDQYTAYAGADRIFQGDANVNGEPGFTYLVEVIDNGEPGRGDLFRIAVSNGHCSDSRFGAGGCAALSEFDGILEGGNIQIHKQCPAE